MTDQITSNTVLFPVPREMVDKLINLYSKVYAEDMKKVKESKCNWCEKKNTDHAIKCNECGMEFINCAVCWNHGRFHCKYPCMDWVCKGCAPAHLAAKHTG